MGGGGVEPCTHMHSFLVSSSGSVLRKSVKYCFHNNISSFALSISN